jgi:hypothetical protein
VDDKPKDALIVRDFPGINTNVDAMDLPAGAARIQVNMASYRPALLILRPGLRQLQFEED